MTSTNGAHAYCTYFDSRYLARGVTLIRSLRAHGDEAPVLVLALDDEVERWFAEHPVAGVSTMTRAELERFEPRLPAATKDRSAMEAVFTGTPHLVRALLERPGVGLAIYLDADLWFTADPRRVVAALGERSVGIIEHRYPPDRAVKLAKFGRFNVGWVGFRDDDHGRAVAQWWGERTLEWCRDVPEDGRYADQGYLDTFPEFPGVVVLDDPGFDLAPWNTRTHDITRDGDTVLADGHPLVFFHAHGLRRLGPWWVTAQSVYGAPLPDPLRELVYRPYVDALDAFAATESIPAPAAARRGRGIRGIAFAAARRLRDLWSVLRGTALRAR